MEGDGDMRGPGAQRRLGPAPNSSDHLAVLLSRFNVMQSATPSMSIIWQVFNGCSSRYYYDGDA